jgi:two-component SAPR family response regulator
MINGICIDDNTATIDLITKFCAEIQFIELQKSFETFMEANRFIRKHPVDLIFVNTLVHNASGIDFYRGGSQNCMVVFISDSKDFAVEAFDLNAVDYLLQPFDSINA